MVTFPVLFFCVWGLFMTLLQDRYRIWTTVGVLAGAFTLSVLSSALLKDQLNGPTLAEQLPCVLGVAVFFVASVFIHTNNLLQKLFVSALCVGNFAYALLFIPLLLGALPFSTAGALGGFLTLLLTLLVYILMGLCLYRPLQRFSERGPSLFLAGMLLLTLLEYLLCLGRLDPLFGIRTPSHRLLLATAVYGALIFCFRSIYQAGRWQARAAQQAAREQMLEMESGDFVDMLASVREVRAAQKGGEYALDTVAQLLQSGQADQAPDYITQIKRSLQLNPILTAYHKNPYLNAVIATKAAFAAQNGIEFQCNAGDADGPVRTAELCVLVNEMLTRACGDAAVFEGEGPRRLRFTAIPGEDSLRLETVFSGSLPEKQKFSPKGKKLTDLLAWLFDDAPPEETELRGLDNTAEIVLGHSGSLTVSGTQEEVIIRALLRF